MEKYLSHYEKSFCEKAEKNISFEVTLPDFLPNAEKTVKITAVPITESCEISGDSVYIGGHIKFTVVYLSDFKDKLKCTSFSTEFSHTFPAKNIQSVIDDGGFADSRVSLSDEKGRTVSQRSLVLSCKALIEADVFSVKKSEIMDSEEKNDAEMLCREIECTEIRRLQDCILSSEENITLDEGMPKIREIICPECTVGEIRAEISGDAVIFDGTLCFGCLYLGEDDEEEGQYISFEKKIPFSTRMPVQSIPENAFVLCKAYVSDISASPLRDSYGETSICNANSEITISSVAFIPYGTKIVCDAFSTRHDCECEIKSAVYDSFLCGSCEVFNINEKVRTNLGGLTEAVSQCIDANVISTEISGKNIVFNIKANLKLSGINELGGLESLNTSFVFKITSQKELHDLTEKQRIDAGAHICDCRCRIENGEIVCSAVLNICYAVCSVRNVKAVTAMTVDENNIFSGSKSEYVIYYPCTTDTVWSCAKHYRVPVKALLEFNGMTEKDDDFKGKHSVIIPVNV